MKSSSQLIYLFKHSLGNSSNNNLHRSKIHVPFLLNAERPVALLKFSFRNAR